MIVKPAVQTCIVKMGAVGGTHQPALCSHVIAAHVETQRRTSLVDYALFVTSSLTTLQ